MPITPGHGPNPTTVHRPLSPSTRSTTPLPPPPAPPLPPPPAPPLPSQQRYVQRAATAFGRLAHPFLYGSRPSSAQGHRDGGRRGPEAGLRPGTRRSSSPVSSRSTTHKTGIPIAALDISPEGTHAVLAGRDILKTIKIADANCTEDFNLRSKLSAYASAHNASRDAAAAQHRDRLAASDVKWSRGVFNTTIATAAANGRIVIYDLNRPSIEIGRFHEHSRQVHRIAFNPHQGALLISGSQDGTVRMWDLRDLSTDRAVRVSGSIKKFHCHSDGVRDLRWSPTDGVEFAVGTDSGVIQRWDFRRENAPILKLNGHEKTCLSLDWHPGGRYLASGSADKLVKIWDFKSNDRRMKPQWQLRAPQGVAKVRWQPTAAGLGDDSQDHRHVTCLATSYDAKDPRIHIWDFLRPHVPFKEVCKYDSMPTDLLWHSEDLLWSTNAGGIFTQADVKFAPTVVERLNVNVLTTGPDGRFCYFSEYRPKKQSSLPKAKEQFLSGIDSQASSGEKFQPSSNPADGLGEEGISSSSSLKNRRQRFASHRKPSHASGTSSAGEIDSKPADKNLLEPLYQSTQVPASGHILGVSNVSSFKSLARSYNLPSWRQKSSSSDVIDAVRGCFERNALVAAQTGQYRLAQTWNILALSACAELKLKVETASSTDSQKRSGIKWFDGKNTAYGKYAKDGARVARASTLTSPNENSSSMTTPLARPVRGRASLSSIDVQALEPIYKPAKVSFTSPFWQEQRTSDRSTTPQPGPTDNQAPPAQLRMGVHSPSDAPKSQAERVAPSFDAFPDMEKQMQERRDAMNNYRAKPRNPLRLDNPEDARSPLAVPRIDRHDSSESLQMFAGSQDSDSRSVPFTGSFDESRKSNDVSAAVSFESPSGAAFEARQQSRHSESLKQDSLDQQDGGTSSPSLQFPFPSSLSHESPLVQSDQEEAASSLREIGFMPVKRPSIYMAPTILMQRSTYDERPSSPPKDIYVLFANDSTPLRANPAPWTLPALVGPLLDFHLDNLSDTQLPSFLVLSLYPFFPALFEPITRCHSYLLAYHEQLESLRLFTEAATLRNAWHPFFPDLTIEATADQGRGTDKEKAALWCEECARPVKGDEVGWCERCCTEWAACPLCAMDEPPPEADLGIKPANLRIATPTTNGTVDVSKATAAVTGLGLILDQSATDEGAGHKASTAMDGGMWMYCQGCGHGGHAQCLTAWWKTTTTDGAAISAADRAVHVKDDSDSSATKLQDTRFVSEGGCPVLGCLHDCAPGMRRMSRRRELERRKARASTVVKDDWIASESRAVGSATRSLSLGTKGKGAKVPP